MIGRSHRERWHGRRLPPRGAKPTGALQFPVRWTAQRGLFIRRAKPTKPSVLTRALTTQILWFQKLPDWLRPSVLALWRQSVRLSKWPDFVRHGNRGMGSVRTRTTGISE